MTQSDRFQERGARGVGQGASGPPDAAAGDRPPDETVSVIYVRAPVCLREMLKLEAEAVGTSLNKLCLAKLRQPLGEGALGEGSEVRRGESSIGGRRSGKTNGGHDGNQT